MDDFTMSFTVRVEAENRDKLRVPDALEGLLKDGLVNIELVLDGTDDSWFVTLVHEESDNGWKMYLDIGWSDFMDENALNAGDVLMFKYIPTNTFAVRIIYRPGPPQSGLREQVSGLSNTSKKRGRKPAIESMTDKMLEANAWLDQLADVFGEASFKFLFTKKYHDQKIINIPLPFAKTHFMGLSASTDVMLQYFDEQFKVELKIVMKNSKIIRCYLTNGVKEFVEHYNVQVDEAALFKYREGDPIVFDVDLVLV